MLKIKKKKIYYILLSAFFIIPMFRPRTLNLYNSLSNLFYGLQCLLVLSLIVLIILRVSKKGLKQAFSPVSYLVIIYKIYESVAIYVNGVFEMSTIVNAGIIIAATVVADYLLSISPVEYLGMLTMYTGFLVFINNLSFFTMGSSSFTDATGNYIYFWSTRNHLSSLFFITFVSTILLYGIKRTKFIQFWCLFTIVNVLWGMIMFNSATTIVGIAVLFLLYLLFKRKSVLYRPVIWFFCGVGLNVAVVMFRVQEIFAWLIENLLHRNLTLTHRTFIWDTALLYILQRPIWGYGGSSIFSFYFAGSEIPAHNQFLDIAIVCGIPGLILFGIILFSVFQMLGKFKESPISRLVACALFGYMIMSIAESPNPYQPWFILFAVAYRVPEIDHLYKNVSYKFTKDFKIHRKITLGSKNAN